MRIRTCLLVTTVLFMGCGGGSGNVPDGATNQQCNPTASCIACVAQSCDSQAKVVFGTDYQSGNFSGGACPNFFACTCNKTDMESVCAQADGANCATAFDALGACLDSSACFDSACKGNSSTGLTVNGNAMDFGPTELGTAPVRCMLVTGPNSSTIVPQVLNDTGCMAGDCAFMAVPLYSRAPDSNDACVVFAPRIVGALSATLSIAPGLNVALSGVGIMSTLPGTGGAIIVTGTGGNIGFGGVIGTGGRTGAGGTTSLATGGTTTVSSVGGSTSTDGGGGTGGSVDAGRIDGIVDAPNTGGIIGSGGSAGTGGNTIIVIIGTGGSIGSGGAVGTGGTTVDAGGPACPLGTWTTTSGLPTCDGVSATLKTTIAQATSGEYIAVTVIDPMSMRNFDTGVRQCRPVAYAGLSVSYAGNRFKYSFAPDEAMCPEKRASITMVIDEKCEKAVVEWSMVNCLICPSDPAEASECGTLTCPQPNLAATRSTQ